ncbi:MAG: hypothetical protein HUJ22_09055 [Gracilimonas sp.]|uniref:hypothetical protein n=1 Tax=Gracilimonas sp. TaxID=1974203 RepID=UPI0019969769|nr:hypothetical protein [Gracilimonas sp.]MBD3616710.1 hypothetical protein [Gracilimonas sp.]
MSTTKERKKPRISINKLGEYMTGTPFNRKTIITEQKKPPVFKSAYYQFAELAIVSFLSSINKNISSLDNSINELQSFRPSKGYQRSKNRSNIEAITSFKNAYQGLSDLSQYSIKRGSQKVPKLKVGGVNISIRPELILTTKNDDDNNDVGVIKLYFSKNSPLDEETGNYISTATHQWVEKNLVSTELNAPHHMTLVYDVFSGKIFTPPRSFIKRRKDIEAACEEIYLMWPHM